MLLREWTTATPAPHVIRLESWPLTNEVTVSVDGIVVHCRPALLGLTDGFRHELLIDGVSYTVIAGTALGTRGSLCARTSALPPDLADPRARFGRRAAWLLFVSLAFAAASIFAKPVVISLPNSLRVIPVLQLMLELLAVVSFAIAAVFAFCAGTGFDPARARRTAALGQHAVVSRLGARPRSGPSFRPLLEDIRLTARRWKLGLPRFWSSFARLRR